MYNRNLRGGHRGRRGRQGANRRRNLGWVIALGTAIPVLVTGYFLASPSPEHVAAAADVQGAPAGTSASGASLAGAVGAAPADPGAGGWGGGGYPMMPMPGSADGNASGGAAANAPAGGAAAATQVVSANWAGYAATGAAGTFKSVSSSWAQPAVTCGGTDTFSSFWVGLDGDGTATVEQTGTEADCANGAATYQGWWEIFPNAPVFYPNQVQPGDAMSASVVSNGDGTFTLTLSDGTQGWTQTTQQAEAGAQLGSAEVIAEAPSNGTAVLPLADFGAVNFSNALVNNAPIGNSANLSELTMESAGGVALATPSALTGGNAFSVTADNGTAAAAPGNGAGGGPGPVGGGGGASDGGGRRHHHHVWGF